MILGIMIVGGLVLFGIAAVGAVLFFDTAGAVVVDGRGVVRGKMREPGGAHTNWINAAGTNVPLVTAHEPSYHIDIEGPGKRRDIIEVTRQEFHRFRVGQEVAITFALGRFTNWLYVHDVFPPTEVF